MKFCFYENFIPKDNSNMFRNVYLQPTQSKLSSVDGVRGKKSSATVAATRWWKKGHKSVFWGGTENPQCGLDWFDATMHPGYKLRKGGSVPCFEAWNLFPVSRKIHILEESNAAVVPRTSECRSSCRTCCSPRFLLNIAGDIDQATKSNAQKNEDELCEFCDQGKGQYTCEISGLRSTGRKTTYIFVRHF